MLRKRKFSDTSLIVSWCTESFGCIQTIAKGARRPKSPFTGKLDLFFEAEISVVRSRKSDLHTLTEVMLKNPFAGIRSKYLRTQSAAYFVELIEICTERDHREPELFALLHRAFGYLDANDPTPRAVSHFETELARIAGEIPGAAVSLVPTAEPSLSPVREPYMAVLREAVRSAVFEVALLEAEPEHAVPVVRRRHVEGAVLLRELA